jgi:hypothetical protein
MVKAAAAGVVDFKEFNPHSITSWTRLKIVLNQIDRESHLRVLDMQHRQQLSMLSHPDMTKDSLDNSWKIASELIDDTTDVLFPWRSKDDDDSQQKSVHAQLREAWVSAWGDPKDPKVAAKIKATADWLRRTDQSRQAGTR